jgi:glycosyltransferase involved in cell wall biosynthesis
LTATKSLIRNDHWLKKLSDGSMSFSISQVFSLAWRILLYAIRQKRPTKVMGEPAKTRTVHIDVTRIAEKDIRTGIQRVVRQISRHWYCLPDRQVKLNFVKVGKSGSLENAWEWAASVIEGFTSETEASSPVFHPGDVYFALDLILPPRGLNTWQVRQLRKLGVRIVFMVYDLLPLTHPQYFRVSSRLFFKWWSNVLRSADQLVTISQVSKVSIERFLGKFFDSPNSMSNVVVIPLSGEPEGFKTENIIQNEGPSHPGGKLFISIGTLEPRKGYGDILKAFDDIWANDVAVSWWIFGSEGWKVRRLAQKIIRHPEFGKRLKWYRQGTDEELAQALRMSEALIIFSKAEGLGLPILEAQELGVPVIARDIEVFREILGQDGLLVEDNAENRLPLSECLKGNMKGLKREPSEGPQSFSQSTWFETALALDRNFPSCRESS